MNLFEIQERLKDFSKDQLIKEMQMPSGSAPPFLVLSELQRRTRLEQAMKADGQGQPQSTVAEDAVNAAGVPQGGLQDMARALAPQTDMTQNTGAAPVQAMQEGGQVENSGFMNFGPPDRARAPVSLISMLEAQNGVPFQPPARWEMFTQGAAPAPTSMPAMPAMQAPMPMPAMQAPMPQGMVRSGSAQLQSVFDQIFGGGAASPMVPQIMSYADRVARLPVRTPPAAYTPSEPVNPVTEIPDMSTMDASALAALIQSAPDLATREAALEAMKALQGAEGGFRTPAEIAAEAAEAAAPARPEREKEPGTYAAGGLVRYQQGGLVDMATRVSTDPAVIAMANRAGLSVQEYISQLDPEARRQLVRNAERPGRTTGTALDAGTPDLLPPAREAAVPEGAVTFEEWRGMTRAQREAEGLPVSELGGQLQFNRFMQGLGADETTLMPTPLEYGPPRRREFPPAQVQIPDQTTQDVARQFEAEAFGDDFMRAQLPLPGQTSGRPENIFAPMTEAIEGVLGPARETAPGVDTGTPPQIPEGGVQEPAPLPDTTRAAPPGGAGGAGATGVPANAQMSDNERMLNQDKWLALARVGLGLMASQAPTFGQALGEAGMAGMEALQSARADYLERKQTEELMAMRRAAAAARGSGGREDIPELGISANAGRLLERLDEELFNLTNERSQMDEGGWFRGQDPRIEAYDGRIAQLEERRRALLDYYAGGFESQGSSGVYSTTDVRQ